ncbi:meiosis 1 arrest protein-like isoform X2 [Cimex lectularius]|uniref:Uncharacterized protein n=1 Tax=Cimex lectularius TaxID=79782 RepID=A0A8I6S9V7_CIMLE|nr:meiosis 1 arrest protein-like isoform X2 [Cimex lectularius]
MMDGYTARLEMKARHLIIDLGSPMDSESLLILTQACQNVFALLCSTHDQSYNTVISIGAISDKYETLLKSTMSYGSFGKISKALNNAKNSMTTNFQIKNEEFNDYLVVGINSIIEDLKTENKILDLCDEVYDVDVCVITLKNAMDIKYFLNSLMSYHFKLHLKGNTVLQLVLKRKEEEETNIEDYYKLKTKDDIVCSLKKWLFNKKYNREQLRLLLPDDAILCDLKENMLRPSLLTFSHKFYIQKDTSCGNISQKKVKIQCESKVYELQVTLRVLSSGLCESLIFGEALNVVPTAFCQGVYEDALLINKQKFYSLCISLLNKEEYLIAKLTDEPPTGYFVLMPSHDSLLIKPIVCQDLWLPDDKSRELTPPQGVLIEKMEQSLALVDIVQEYKVGLNSSGLYTALLKFHESKIKRSKKNEDEDDDGVEGTSSWVTISHPALEDKHPLKKSKRKCRRPDPLKCIEYIKK